MKKILPVLALAFCGLASADIDAYSRLEKKAFNGDYQAQRNIAYTLSTDIPHNSILGCAWRIVILESGNEQVDDSDVHNKEFYCDKKLTPDGIRAAYAQAINIQAKIKKRRSK
jgi:hypothetical protein